MKNDLKGQKFGRLLVLKEAGRTPGRQVIWECQCECGNCIKVRAQDLRNGHTKSCGCYKKDRSTEEKRRKAYDRKAVELFGEFAKLNFPKDENDA